MSVPRRPSVSIHDYPEDLNPFKDGNNTPASTVRNNSSEAVELRQNKEPKNKFWTFGRSKKKRSNSFSVKSAWNGLFGKRKESEPERRTTITTVSTSYQNYQNGQSGRPVPPPRLSRDQQEFDQAFGTFTRRKKYTMESSSTYGSNLTVNGDPARLYNGSPQDTTTSILGELTPKPPARRFGQVSPRPKDEIPPLEFELKEENSVSHGEGEYRIREEVPVPTRRLGRKSVPRVNVLNVSEEEDREELPSDLSLRDENENLADDNFVFRRCSQDAVRRSNLSINSCVSTASGYSTLGRKKRRAPQPPQRKEPTELTPEKKPNDPSPSPSTELKITESIDIAKVTEDIQQMTKDSENIDETMRNSLLQNNREAGAEEGSNKIEKLSDIEDNKLTNNDQSDKLDVELKNEQIPGSIVADEIVVKTKNENSSNEKTEGEEDKEERIEVENVEINRIVEDTIEIIKDVSNRDDDKKYDNGEEEEDEDDEDDVDLRRKKSGAISRSDSFSVKEQIEQIERQIKELESKSVNNNNNNNNSNNNNNNSSGGNNDSNVEEIKYYEPSETRLSIQANRRSFFKNMVNNDPNNGVKIEIKELPREQREIHVVKLTDPPVPIDAPKEPVKIVALHISEPIKQFPEIVEDVNVNPLPKPRRHSSTAAQSTLSGDNDDDCHSNNGFSNNNGNNNDNNNRNTRGDSL